MIKKWGFWMENFIIMCPWSLLSQAASCLLFLIDWAFNSSHFESAAVPSFCFSYFFWKFYTMVAQTGLKLAILLPQLPECWDYSNVPPHFSYYFDNQKLFPQVVNQFINCLFILTMLKQIILLTFPIFKNDIFLLWKQLSTPKS